jgi:hypothetical protein
VNRFIRVLLAAGSLLLLTGQAQSAWLVRIETSPAGRVELSRLGVPVFKDLRSSVLAPMEEREVRTLREQGFRVEVLDREAAPGEYFLVFKAGPGRDAHPGRLLWENERLRLVRMPEIDALRAKTQGYEMVQLPGYPHPLELAEPSEETLSPAPDTIIQRLVGMISEANLRQTILELQAFRTRYSTNPRCDSAAQYLHQRFSALGLDSVDYDYYLYQGYNLKNVDALYRGRVRPESLVITGGHFDSYSNQPQTLAPGADDDASGVAAALEIARVLRTARFRKTLRYLAFSGEEQWMKGSTHWVDFVAVPRGLRIDGFYNLDMIGYTASDTSLLYVTPNTASRSLAVLAESANAQYGIGLHVANYWDEDAAGDHTPFWDRGFKAVFVIEDSEWGIWNGSNPHYHTTHDTLGNLRMSLVTRATRLAAACLATLAEPMPGSGVEQGLAQGPALGGKGISLVPNPMRDGCTVSAPWLADEERWSIYDATGRLVKTGTFEKGRAFWDGRDRSGRYAGNGVYFLRVKDLSGAETARLVLLR